MSTHLSSIREPEFTVFRPVKTANDWVSNLPIISLFYPSSDVLKLNYYDNGVVESDFRIGQIFGILENKGILGNSIVWIVGDHGEALGEHGNYGHVRSLYQEELGIPMLVVDSQKDKYAELDVATQLDIAPTILDRLGVEIPKDWKGDSLLQRRDREVLTYHEIPSRLDKQAVVLQNGKDYIYKAIYQRSPLKILELYNLVTDKHELNNLAGTNDVAAIENRILNALR